MACACFPGLNCSCFGMNVCLRRAGSTGSYGSHRSHLCRHCVHSALHVVAPTPVPPRVVSCQTDVLQVRGAQHVFFWRLFSGTCCATLRCYPACTVLCSFLLHCCGAMCYVVCYGDGLHGALMRCGVKGCTMLRVLQCVALCCVFAALLCDCVPSGQCMGSGRRVVLC